MSGGKVWARLTRRGDHKWRASRDQRIAAMILELAQQDRQLRGIGDNR